MNEALSVNTGESYKLPSPELMLTHLDELPTLAPIAIKLLQVTADDTSSARDVVEALHGDQSLTAKVLSIANSPIVGAVGKIPTLDRAVVLLGFKAVRAIALTVKVFECLSPDTPSEGADRFDRKEFWKHSLGVACAARILALQKLELGIESEEAFVAGLLHDLGKVALDTVFPKAYARVALHAEETRGDIADCERAILGIDHTVAGRHLAKRWGLPGHLQDAIWLHHVSAETLSPGVTSPKLIALIQLADTYVREQRIGHSGNYAFYETSSYIASQQGFAEVDFEELARKVVSEVADYVSLLGVDQSTPETLYLKSLTSANTELGRLNTELLATNRRLAAGARYFKGITRFDHQLEAAADLPAVVAAIADASAAALQRGQLAAFGIHDQRTAVEIYFSDSEAGQHKNLTQRLTDEMSEWLAEPGDLLELTVTHAPAAVRALLTPIAGHLGEGRCWLLPIVHAHTIAGGIAYLSEHDERAELAPELEELHSFLTSLGLALGRVNAQAAARRLSEDLAESNRRLQQMQAEVLRTRTLSIIAEMATGAGHELNGPLTVISGRAQLLMDSTVDAHTRKSLEQIHHKAHECARIVTELMDFAQPHPPRPEVTDLRSLLTVTRDSWLSNSGIPTSRLNVDLPGENGPQLYVDREQIRSVLDEVLGNAVEAVSSNNGSITVRWRSDITAGSGGRMLRDRESEAEESAQHWIEIVVQDSGCGMSPTVLQRAFDPFYSHRAAGRGRGLGLARAHRIVEAHGGRIWAISQPDEGATFHIMLPQASS